MTAANHQVGKRGELPGALLLTESEIRSLVTPSLALAAVRDAFIAHARGKTLLPDVLHMDLPGHRGEIHVKGAYLDGASTWCVKAASAFYANHERDLPIATGVSLALSAETGFLRAVLLDNGYLTELRTGAAGALAADLLAPPIVRHVLIVGSGSAGALPARGTARRAATGARERPQPHARTRGQLRAGDGSAPPAAHRRRRLVERRCQERGHHRHSDTVAEPDHRGRLAQSRGAHHRHGLRSAWQARAEVAVLERAEVLVADHIDQARTQGELQHGFAAEVIHLGEVVELGALAAGTRTRPHLAVADHGRRSHWRRDSGHRCRESRRHARRGLGIGHPLGGS